MFDINIINSIAKKAGAILMSYYRNDNIYISYKHDSSPVTDADLASHNFIHDELYKLKNDIPILSEEGNQQIATGECFWLIDPLDGTKGFLSDGSFTVNIALIIKGKPILGVIYSPLENSLYYAQKNGPCYKQIDEQKAQIIKTRATPEQGVTILTSQTSLEDERLKSYINANKVDKILSVSSSLKFCLIAEGKADLYLRLGTTMEWDTAAGQAILEAAGGAVKTLSGADLTYGNIDKKYCNPEFVATGL